MNCAICGGSTSEITETRPVKYRDETVEVATTFLRCDSCKEELVTPKQMRDHVRGVKNEVRKKQGLLSPEKIATIRQKLGLTQVELEELLGTGPKVVVRWESGKVIQGNGHDTTLRLLERNPGLLKQLREIAKARESEQKTYARAHGQKPEVCARV